MAVLDQFIEKAKSANIDNVFEVKIDSFLLDIVGVTDNVKRDVVEFNIPFTKGGITQDLGVDIVKTTLRAVFWGSQETRGAQLGDTPAGVFPSYYANHTAFIDHVKDNDLFSFRHPLFGDFTTRIRSVNVNNNETWQDGVELAIELVQADEIKQSKPIENVKTKSEKGFFDAVIEARAALREGLGAVSDLVFSDTESIIDGAQFLDSQTQLIIKDLDDELKRFERLTGDVSEIVGSLIQTISFAQTLDDRILNSIGGMLETFAAGLGAVSGAAAVSSMKSNIEKSQADILEPNIKKAFITLSAARLGVVFGGMIEQEQEQRRKIEAFEKMAQIGQDGEILPPVPNSLEPQRVSTTQELNAALGVARDYILEAIRNDNNANSLRTLARNLTEGLEKNILRSSDIQTIIVQGEIPERFTPLPLVLMREGLPMRSLEKNNKLNNFKNPIFATGEVLFYAN